MQLWIAAANGLYFVKSGTTALNRVDYIKQTPILSLTIDSTGLVAAGTHNMVRQP
jgi:ligand-binding sensor domain-containing protein